MKFTKKELTGIVKICDVVSKMKDESNYKGLSFDQAKEIIRKKIGKDYLTKTRKYGNQYVIEFIKNNKIVASYLYSGDSYKQNNNVNLLKIHDAMSKVKDSLESELYSKMRSAYPNAIKHKAVSRGAYRHITFTFKNEPNKQILSILKNMGFTIKVNFRDDYSAKKGNIEVEVVFSDTNAGYLIEVSIYE